MPTITRLTVICAFFFLNHIKNPKCREKKKKKFRIIFVLRRREHVFVHWQQGKYQLWANYFMHGQYHGCWCPGDASSQGISNHDIDHVGANSELRTPQSEATVARNCVKHPNHSAMTHPSKMDWHQSYGIRHPTQQWASYGQEEFSTGLLTTWHWCIFLLERDTRTWALAEG